MLNSLADLKKSIIWLFVLNAIHGAVIPQFDDKERVILLA